MRFQIYPERVILPPVKLAHIPRSILCISGVDPMGFSGIAMDLRVLASHGVHASIAVTALTSQTQDAVLSIGARVPADVVRDIKNVFRHRRPDAIKIGMLGSEPIASSVARVLRRARGKSIPVVMDPVLAASSGGRLALRGLLRALTNDLLPLCTVITPNVPEAEALLGSRIRTVEEMTAAARALSNRYGTSIYLKGGHLAGVRVVDILVDGGTTRFLGGRTIRNRAGKRLDPRGTGCALASALAANLAQGMSIPQAAISARRTVVALIRNEIGAG